MSRSVDQLMVLPNDSGWSLWRVGGKGTELLETVDAASPREILKIPTGEITMVFPVRQATGLPMRANTADPSLFADLAEMHVERFGMRPDPTGGVLFDYFEIERSGEEAKLLPTVLAPQLEDAMPRRSPAHFDISPRVYQLYPDCITVWKELGRLVYAVTEGSNLAYFQGLSTTDFGPAAIQEINLAILQLGLQGFQLKPDKIVVWNNVVSGADVPELEKLADCSIVLEAKPEPHLPAPTSKLLPADVSAARRKKQAKQRTVALVSAIAIAYLGLIGYAGFKYWKTADETKKLKTELASIAPQTEALEQHIGKWNELDLMVDQTKWPVELLFHIKKSMPSGGAIRLKTAEIAEGEIRLDGEAQTTDQVKKFNLQLKRSTAFSQTYSWDTPSAQQTRDGRWSFIYTGTPQTGG